MAVTACDHDCPIHRLFIHIILLPRVVNTWQAHLKIYAGRELCGDFTANRDAAVRSKARWNSYLSDYVSVDSFISVFSIGL